ncbi:MAG TPA: methionyl-tRNA formyltransferase [Polyangiaceae bacterium]|nr:methionyl-tRNA formyltransferase [Polyangiaceae bacterium]
MNGKPVPFRAVFFGTPAIALPSLRTLGEIAEVVGVVTQPDRPRGRGLELQAPEVKTLALELGLDVTQPAKVRTGELRDWLRARRPDVLVVLAYGRILPNDVLEVAPHGAINLHASLLPRYRGAAPIAWSIIRGETETGVSLMRMDAGMDTGPVLSRHALSIGEDETAGELTVRLGELAAAVLRQDLPRALTGELTPEPQDEARATLAPPLERDLGRLDFTRPARELKNLVRGLAPRPGAYTTVGAKTLRVASVGLSEASRPGPPGTVHVESGVPWVATGVGSLEIVSAQLEGKRVASGRDLVNGRVLRSELVLGG